MHSTPALAQLLKYSPGLAGTAFESLGEGGTPLIKSRRIGPSVGHSALFFKLENLNPTGSYKDRFASVAIALAKHQGARRVIATSSGNTGAAVAAYSSAANMHCTVFVTERAPAGKLVQMRAYGAKVIRVSGMGVDSSESAAIASLLRTLSIELGIPLLVSAYAVAPMAMEGIKTLSYEIADQLPSVKHVIVPVGGGGLYVGVARGFNDLALEDFSLPQVHAVQPQLNDTIITPWREGLDKARSVDTTTTISGLAVARDLDGSRVIGELRRNGGSGTLVTDQEVREIQTRLLREEVILAEPAGAVSTAGAIKLIQSGRIANDEPVVCIISGHSYKDSLSWNAVADDQADVLIARADVRAVLENGAAAR